MGALRALALGALLAIPGGMDPKDLQKLIGAIREGDGESAARLLEGAPVRDGLRSDAKALSDVCFFGDSSSRILARKAPAAAPRAAAALLVLTSDWLATDPGSFPVLRGRFHALLADARIRKELGLPVAGEPFAHAGEGMELLYERAPEDGIYLLAAARAFADGASTPGERGPALWDRAEKLVARIREKHPEAWESIAGAFEVLLDRVRWGAARREKGLDGRLDYAMGYLAEARKAAPDNLDLVSAFNDAVSTARELGIRRPGMEFEANRINPCSGLQASIPLGRRWSASPSGGAQVVQYDPDFGPARTFGFTTYQWESPYDLPDGSVVRGDSMKDLAGKYFEVAAGRLKRVQTRRPVAAGRLKQCPAGWTFEIAGVDEKGAFVRRREWYFKSTMDRRQTYRIAVVESRPDVADDPSFQSVLESIRETPK